MVNIIRTVIKIEDKHNVMRATSIESVINLITVLNLQIENSIGIEIIHILTQSNKTDHRQKFKQFDIISKLKQIIIISY